MTDIEITDTEIVQRNTESNKHEQRGWAWYDWATSGFYTTVLTVLFGPLMITVAGRAAGCGDSADETCTRTVNVLGVDLAAGSLPSYITSFATALLAVVLPMVGVMADRSRHKKWHMAWFGWAGAVCCGLLFFLRGDDWQFAAVVAVLGIVFGGCSMTIYYAMLVDVSTEQDRDQVALRGSALGYLGGGVLLVVNLAMVLGHDAIGVTEEYAVRLSLLSAAIWWAVFMIIPVRRIRSGKRAAVDARSAMLLRRSFTQLWTTFKEVRSYPVTMTYLVAFVFINDGIQTVIYSASIFGAKQLHLDSSAIIVSVLLLQFVAFGAALMLGRWTGRFGGYRILVWGTGAWVLVVAGTMFLPERNVLLYLMAALAVAVAMGATLALSRSVFSLLIPAGREAEYFALYGVLGRGTSWSGVFLFGLVFQLTGSYRPAILSLVLFFLVGLYFLLKVDPRRGISDVGNRIPSQI